MFGKRHNKKGNAREDNVEYKNEKENRNNRKKNGNRNKKKKLTCIIFTIILAVVIMACPTVVPIIFMLYDVKNPFEGTEATLVTLGIAIIGVAITAWTGLNIANSVNRNELEKIEKRERKIRRKFVRFMEQLTELKKDSENIKKSVENSLINNCNARFLQELLKTVKDTCSLYFYKRFNAFFSEQKFDTVKSQLLMEIEQNFAEIYSLHNYDSDVGELLISKANDGLEKIKEYESNEQPEGLVKQYLDYRRGEINYYKGYCEDGPKDVYECFVEAAEVYINFANEINIPLKFNEQKYDDFIDYNGDFLEMACYLSGSIGDAYSGIVDKCMTQEKFRTKRGYITKKQIVGLAKQSIYFCGCAAKWSKDNLCENEVYYRNLGVAYERFDRINETPFKHKREIMDNYKYAFRKMHNNIGLFEKRKQNIYHTILSYFERCFKEEFSKLDGDCLKYTRTKRKLVLNNTEEISKYRDEIIKMISKIKIQGDDVIDAKMLYEYVITARSGVDHNPHYTLRISLLGLSYTYVVFLIKAGNESAKQVFVKPLEYYIAEIEKLISYLDIVDMTDDYANELRLRYKGIMGL